MARIIVQGGAYAIPDELAKKKEDGCKKAAIDGYSVLEAGGSALDAVEVAVKVLEDDYTFNAGHGSVLNSAGEIEMDAIVMEGKDLRTGAVAGVRNIANPVSLARKVMEDTSHIMLIGEGAMQFAQEQGFSHVSTEELISAESKSDYKNFSKYTEVVEGLFNRDEGHDTVGAVARDCHGNIACATSTGGISHKMVGRVGDSPLIGSGAYCNNDTGGVSCTGHGEAIARVTLAQTVLFLSQTMSAKEAVKKGFQYMWNRVGGCGGLVMITKEGDIVKGFSTPRMAWASVCDGQIDTGIDEPRIKVDD